MKTRILAIDQGTTNTKAVLFDDSASVVSRGESPVAVRHPRPGWVEQDGREIWKSVQAAVAGCLRGRGADDIAAVGISNQRESVIAWRARDGAPLGPCVTWQCRRAADICERLRREGEEDNIRAKTGLPLSPLFSAGKARWLAERAECPPDEVRVGTVDSWLLWNLTNGGRHACDESNAARTQLFNIAEGAWDDDLCGLFGVRRASLPEALPSAGIFGKTLNAAPLPDGLPVCSLVGDSHAALFGHGVSSPGTVKATYGTGSSLMTLLPEFRRPTSDAVVTIAWNIGGRTYALEGNILVSASVLPWAAKWLGLGGDPAKVDALAQTAEDSEGVFLVPALTGLGAPHWDARARGVVCGLTFNAELRHLARAAMESIAFQVCDVFDAMRARSSAPLKRLLTDGAPSGNDWLMALQADLLGAPVWRSETAEVSALGAAGMAGVAAGVWRDADEFAALPRRRREFTPRMSPRQRERLLSGWRAAVARTLFSPEDGRNFSSNPNGGTSCN